MDEENTVNFTKRDCGYHVIPIQAGEKIGHKKETKQLGDKRLQSDKLIHNLSS